jgi:hypothetical protein
MNECFLEETIKPQFAGDGEKSPVESEKQPYTEQETDEIRKKLSGLGYL